MKRRWRREEERTNDSSEKVQSWSMGEQEQERVNEDWGVGRFQYTDHIPPWLRTGRCDERWDR
jgi:hypothetical protein